jgi:hypothetical protein
MERVRSSVAVLEDAVRVDAVIVRPLTTFHHGRSRDAYGNLRQQRRLEDPLRTDQRNALPVEGKATR